MKVLNSITLFTISAFFSMSAMASTLSTIVISSGGMGTDGATLESMPTENSVSEAAAIYKALNVKPDREGKKNVGVKYDGDIIGLVCEQPGSGIHTKTARCNVLNLTNESAPKNEISIELRGTVVFAPKLSEKIFKALTDVEDTGAVGAVVKSVGNLTCTKVVAPKAKPKCTMIDVSITKVAVESAPLEKQDEIRELARKLGVE